jgi:hypothetical protein
MTVAIQLMGGLGNQLFQIFTTIAHGLEHETSFVFVHSSANDRKMYWDFFLENIKQYSCPPTTLVATLPVFKEKSFSYEKIPQQENDFLLSGYFQSYKYFNSHQEQLFKMIHLKEQQFLARMQFRSMFSLKQTVVSIHFRLGDYKDKQMYHNILPFEYYKNAIQTIVTQVDQPVHFLYVCEKEDNAVVYDMIQQLKAHFPLSFFNKLDDSIVDWKQMLIMSCCHHNIIANSTFSLFSAYFNRHKNKMVCYPSVWFGPALSHYDTRDLFLDDWKKIDF